MASRCRGWPRARRALRSSSPRDAPPAGGQAGPKATRASVLRGSRGRSRAVGHSRSPFRATAAARGVARHATAAPEATPSQSTRRAVRSRLRPGRPSRRGRTRASPRRGAGIGDAPGVTRAPVRPPEDQRRTPQPDGRPPGTKAIRHPAQRGADATGRHPRRPASIRHGPARPRRRQRVPQPRQELRPRDLPRPEAAQVLGVHLAVDELERRARASSRRPSTKADLRRVGPVGVHRLAEEGGAERDAVEAAGQPVVVPGLEGVGVAERVEPLVGRRPSPR